MNVGEYRKKYEAAMAKRRTAAARDAAATSAAGDVVANTGADDETRIDTIQRLPVGEGDSSGNIEKLLAMLRNRAEPTAIRRAALRALKAAAFLGHIFDPHRADYTQCLRDVATESEADSQLREEALEVLAIQNDDFAQGLLLRGLEDPKSALVRTAKAIQFLAYDDHSKAAPVVRKILDRITDVSAKAEALRLLASDPQSQGLFANLLKDKAQPEIIRTLSATGLKLLNPQAFAQAVRELITDKDEREELRATLLSALTQLRERNETDEDPNFVKEVEDLAKDGADALKSSARRFIQRFGR